MVGGPVGAQIGWVAGSLIGSAFTPAQKSQGPRLSDLSVTTSSYGTAIPWVAGSPRMSGQVIWASAKREIATTERSGGKGGGRSEYTSYTYEIDLLYLLSDNQVEGVSRVWSNGELIYSGDTLADGTWTRMTAYSGAPGQLPDPDYEAAVGTANAPAYRGRGTLFIKSLQLGTSGQLPNLTFEFGSRSLASVAAVTKLTTTVTSASYLSAGQPAITGTTFTHLVGQWTNFYENDTVKVYTINAVTGVSNFLREFQLDNDLGTNIGSLSLRGNSDVSCLMCLISVSGQPYQSYVRVWFADGSATSIRVFTVTPASPPIFSRRGNTCIFGFSSIASKALTDHTGQIGTTLADWVYIIFILGDLVYCSSANTPGRIFVCDVATLTLQDTLNIGSNFFISLFDAGNGELGTIQSNGEVRVYGANGWSASLGTYNINNVGLRENAVAVVGGKLLSCFSDAPVNPYICRTGHATITLTPNSPALPDVVSAIMLRAGYSAGQFDVTPLSPAKKVHSLANASVSTARSLLEMLAGAYQFDAVLSDKIYFRNRGTASSATLTFDELGVMVDANNPPDPLPLTQANELEIPAQIALTYANIDGDYQPDTQYSDRLLTGMESTSAIQLPIGFTAAEAKMIAETLLMDKVVSALSTSITVDTSRATIEPMDSITVTAKNGSTFRMRVVRRKDAGGVTTLDCVSDNVSVLTQSSITDGGTTGQTDVPTLAQTTLLLLDIPLLRDADDMPGLYAVVSSDEDNWKSGAIFDSRDNVTYTLRDSAATPAPLGICLNVLGAWTGGNVFDESNTVTVDIGAQQLSSVTWDQLLVSQELNVAMIGTELIQFRVATLVTPGVYTLSGLLRGRRGTTSTGHVANETFVKLSVAEGVRFMPLENSDLARVRYYKGVSQNQALDVVNAQAITPLGNNLRPLAGTDARANKDAADVVISWKRQTRLSTRIVGPLPMSIPVGEATESYEVELWNLGYTVLKRTVATTTTSFTYTSAQQTADFGATQLSFYVRIYQMSAVMGRGALLQQVI